MSTSSGNSSLTSDMIREVFPTLAVKKRIFQSDRWVLDLFTALNDSPETCLSRSECPYKGAVGNVKAELFYLHFYGLKLQDYFQKFTSHHWTILNELANNKKGIKKGTNIYVNCNLQS